MAEDKQFEATARRKQQARDKGQVPRSRDLTAAGVLLLAAFAAPALFTGTGRDLTTALAGALGRLHEADLSREGLRQSFLGWTVMLLTTLAPLMLLVIAASVALSALQGGLPLSTYPLVPRLEKLNPATALKRILSVPGLVETGKSLLKVVLVAAVVWLVLKGRISTVLWLGHMDTHEAAAKTGRLAWELTVKTALAMVVLGAADYAYQRFEHNKSLRMTREEMRQETRETEGDPHVRGQRQQHRRQLLRDGMNARLPDATVVLTNPTHVAVALYYRQGQAEAPIVVARGQGRLAERIKLMARRHAVPVREEPPLARALYAACPLGAQVPPALYRAVAVILAQLYREAAQRRNRGTRNQ